MKTPEEIYVALKTADVLSDQELVIGINHFEQLEKLARQAGPVFELMANEAARVVYTLKEFQRHRYCF